MRYLKILNNLNIQQLDTFEEYIFRNLEISMWMFNSKINTLLNYNYFTKLNTIKL